MKAYEDLEHLLHPQEEVIELSERRPRLPTGIACMVVGIPLLIDPLHRMFSFQFFSYTLTLLHLLCQPKKQFFCLFINIRKIAVQPAACQQVGTKYPAVLFHPKYFTQICP